MGAYFSFGVAEVLSFNLFSAFISLARPDLGIGISNALFQES